MGDNLSSSHGPMSTIVVFYYLAAINIRSLDADK